jgi:hypothetical protein
MVIRWVEFVIMIQTRVLHIGKKVRGYEDIIESIGAAGVGWDGSLLGIQCIHNVDELKFSAEKSQERWVMTNFFVTVTNYANRALVGLMYLQFGAKVENRLQTRIGRGVTALAENMSLLSENGVDASLFDPGFTTVIITVECNLSVVNNALPMKLVSSSSSLSFSI